MPDESTADDDAEFERKDADSVTLYKVSDANGALQVDTISTKPIRQDMLKSEVCFDFTNAFDCLVLFTYIYRCRIASFWILATPSMCGLVEVQHKQRKRKQ